MIKVGAQKKNVLVYAEPLLATSMTFVRTQAEGLSSFLPYYIAPRQLDDGLPLPKERVLIMRSRGASPISEIPFKVFGFAPFFVRRLRRLDPVLLHAHFGPMGLRALPLARRLDIPLVVTFHGYDATVPEDLARKSPHYGHRVYSRKRKNLQSSAALIIAVSNFIRDQLVRQGFDLNQIVVHYIGVDTDFFRPDPDLKREPVVLFTGRLDTVKGCEYLIQAMAKVQASLRSCELVVIGDGPLRHELETLARQSLQRYRFLGYQGPAVVRHWMNCASLFAMPSVRTAEGSHEGLPTVLMEAQAMGLPVVGFASGGIREAILPGETGILVAERDVDALASGLQVLLQNPVRCAEMRVACRRNVCKNFNLKQQTGKLEDHYRRIVVRHDSLPKGELYQEPEGSGLRCEDETHRNSMLDQGRTHA